MKTIPSPGFGAFSRRFLLAAAFGLMGSPWLHAADPQPKLEVRATRPEAVYTTGEPVKFQVTLEPANGSELPAETTAIWHLSRDGCPPITTGTLLLKNGVGEVNGQLDRPGFVHLKVTTKLDNKEVTALGGAAVDPLKITAATPMPDDFDAFWNSKKQELAKVPMNAKLTPVPVKDEEIEAFDVQADCPGGAPVSAYYARPKNARPKSLPAILSVHSAGVRSSVLATAVNWAKEGMISMDLNAHGLPNGLDKDYYDSLRTGQYHGYPSWGAHSRDEFYFLGMFQRLLRAIEFLTSQPEWDGRTLIVQGSSQGGAQAIAAAGLDPRVTFFAARVPAMCDHLAALSRDPAGWPRLVKLNAEGKPVDPRIVETLPYYDAVNFARRARADGFFTVGFVDKTCPPHLGLRRLQCPAEQEGDLQRCNRGAYQHQGSHCPDPRSHPEACSGTAAKTVVPDETRQAAATICAGKLPQPIPDGCLKRKRSPAPASA